MSLQEPTMADTPKFAEVALPLPLRRTFTYRLPDRFAARVKCGARLVVPFGGRTLTGYAVETSNEMPAASDVDVAAVKEAVELIDDSPLITPEILRLTRWTARYYSASWGEMLKAALPAGINSAVDRVAVITDAGRSELLRTTNFKPKRSQILREVADAAGGELPVKQLEKIFGAAAVRRAVRELVAGAAIALVDHNVQIKVRPKMRKAVRLKVTPEEASAQAANLAQAAIIAALVTANGDMLFSALSEAAGSGPSSINTLARSGVIEIYNREILRDPFSDEPAAEPAKALALNAAQTAVLEKITETVTSGGYGAFLLHGVTGSGKTEVYIQAMTRALAAGRSALMLVPEIALTPVFSRRLRAAFGGEVAILHSNLSPGERFDEWRRVRDGRARVVIGTRSAVFAPLRDLGLIVVDEEHDASYRQQESPFYHARDAAVMRAHLNSATIVLGSATPALETFHNAQTDKYQYLRMPHRIENRPLARAELIDMREVFRRAGKDVAISDKLADAIATTYARGEQSIILLNRRGFSAFVLCRSCGESLRCANCDITLTYHRRESHLICHYCGYKTGVPNDCPFCKSEFLYFIGEGTEQLEGMLAARFPQMTIARVDRDTMAGRGLMSKTLSAFDRGEIDMLVGTQMLAKGHDFSNVTLVGVISVDGALGMPDFRSAERAFQLLTQVAGRAGRGSLPGSVLIQTYYPEHYALQFACRQDFDGFYFEEMKYRRRLNYPPYVVLASILIRDKDYAAADKTAQSLRKALDAANGNRACQILGPAAAAIARIKNEYRLQILVKSLSRTDLRQTIESAAAAADRDGTDIRKVQIEIDPINLM